MKPFTQRVFGIALVQFSDHLGELPIHVLQHVACGVDGLLRIEAPGVAQDADHTDAVLREVLARVRIHVVCDGAMQGNEIDRTLQVRVFHEIGGVDVQHVFDGCDVSLHAAPCEANLEEALHVRVAPVAPKLVFHLEVLHPLDPVPANALVDRITGGMLLNRLPDRVEDASISGIRVCHDDLLA
ncbi:hypothetical protein D9M72_502890 [compost metagenome]